LKALDPGQGIKIVLVHPIMLNSAEPDFCMKLSKHLSHTFKNVMYSIPRKKEKKKGKRKRGRGEGIPE
jgi:hypothetical protein